MDLRSALAAVFFTLVASAADAQIKGGEIGGAVRDGAGGVPAFRWVARQLVRASRRTPSRSSTPRIA